jgi:hypothetical protein
MPTPHIRHSRKPDRRSRTLQALEFLAMAQDGASEALLLANSVTVEQMVELVRAGLARLNTERVVGGEGTFEAAVLRVTEAGRRALAVADDPAAHS